MMNSIMEPNKKKEMGLRTATVLLWIGIWQLLSMAGGAGLFWASPFSTLRRFGQLCMQGAFWRAVLFTTGRILTGFGIAAAAGGLLAALTYRWEIMDIVFSPLLRLVRTVPVASFIILALILFSSRYLTQLISFLMAMPVIYVNTRTGLTQMDPQLKEMALLYRVPFFRTLRWLIIPQVFGAFEAGSALALGFAWKSGIAAEVIGIPSGSIGEKLQQAKVYLDTPDLFAYTLTIVLLCVLTEKIWRGLLGRLRAVCLQTDDAAGGKKHQRISGYGEKR